MNDEALRKEVDRLAAEFGISVQFGPDDSLEDYRKGEPLSFKELRALPDGTVVWITYEEGYDEEFSLPCVLSRCVSENPDKESWFLEVTDFTILEHYLDQYDMTEDDHAWEGGQGDKYLYHAIPKS